MMKPTTPESAETTQRIALGPAHSTSPQCPSPQPVRIAAFGATDIGRERKANEDQFLVSTLGRRLEVWQSSVPDVQATWFPTATEASLLVVADGMGGHAQGDVASSTAVSAVADYLADALPWFDRRHNGELERLSGVRVGLADAIHSSELAVTTAADTAHQTERRMGTTLTIAYIRFPLMYVAHVGDSRAYLLRDDVLFRLTRDHTVGERLRDEARKANASPIAGTEYLGEAFDETPFDSVLWNAVGAGPGDAKPDVRRCRLEPDDTIMLCSDGLTAHVDDDQIAALVSAADSPQRACEALIDEAKAGGGSDNITVIVAKCLA